MEWPNVYIRPLSQSDVGDNYLRWVNDEEVTRYLEIGNVALDRADLYDYIQSAQEQQRILVGFFLEENNRHIGNGSIYKIDRKEKSFEIGWLIGEKDCWGGRYAPALIHSLLYVGFQLLGMQISRGYVRKDHLMARMVNGYVGYQEVGEISASSSKSVDMITYKQLILGRRRWLQTIDQDGLVGRLPSMVERLNIMSHHD